LSRTVITLLATIVAVSDAGARAAGPPSSVTPPAVNGAAAEGQVLSASTGVWDGTAPIAYQHRWFRCDSATCTEIAGAMSATYVLTAADVGRSVVVAITASNAEGSATARSSATSVVGSSRLRSLEPPAIGGAAIAGEWLTATGGAWATSGPLEFHYEWLRCRSDGSGCASIDGATGERYRVRRADIASRLLVRVTALTDVSFAAHDSALTAVVTAAPPALIRPFPRVRIKGFFTSTGAVVQLMSVVAPRGARVLISCRGADCPFTSRALAARPGLRVRSLERSLRSGTRIVVRVSEPGRVGKYTSFVIRAARPPARRDRCLMPDSALPSRCPTSG
jgi:hypothetical protein